jgi:hypothetical protein
VIYGLISEGWMIWVMIPISAVGAIVAPAMQGVMSRAAGADQQGELQGVLASISALSMVLSPLMMTQAFFWATRDGGPVWLPGAPFLLSAVADGHGAGDLPRRGAGARGAGHPGGVASALRQHLGEERPVHVPARDRGDHRPVVQFIAVEKRGRQRHRAAGLRHDLQPLERMPHRRSAPDPRHDDPRPAEPLP